MKTLSSLLCLSLAGCSGATAGNECSPANRCSRTTGIATCDSGYEWEDTSDPDNYRCVSAGSGTGGTAGSGGNAGSGGVGGLVAEQKQVDHLLIVLVEG